MITPHIKGLIQKATKALYGLQGKSNKKAPSMNSITVKPPKLDSPNFKKYLANKGVTFPPGTKYNRTEDGKHIYTFPDGKGAKVDIYWDDKNPQSDVADKTSPAPAQQNTPPVTDMSPLTLDNLGSATLDQILGAPPQEIADFYNANKDEVRKIVPPNILKAIEDIFNEAGKP